jgi:uncharacterized protein YbbC (DUF1343 family)
VQIRIGDRSALDAARLGVELAAALRHLYPQQFDLDATTSMFGSRAIVDAIAAGEDPRRIAALWQSQLQAFTATRDKYLLYR